MSYLTMLYNIIIALPKIMGIIRAALKMATEIKKARKEQENTKIQAEVENAKTEDDAQNALNHAANRINRV